MHELAMKKDGVGNTSYSQEFIYDVYRWPNIAHAHANINILAWSVGYRPTSHLSSIRHPVGSQITPNHLNGPL